MGVEEPGDADIFFDPEVFGETFGYVLAAGGGDDVDGIWQDPHTVAAAGEFGGVSTTAPMFTTDIASLPVGYGPGDQVSRSNGNLYRVTDTQPDGAGHIAVILEKV